MKKLILTLLVAMLAIPMAMAQKNLKINRFFTDEMASNPSVVAVTISGKSLEKSFKDSGLTLFRSVTVKDEAIAQEMADVVRDDMRHAVNREVSYKQGRLSFGFYMYPGQGNLNRYVGFLRSNKGEATAILFYLEGTADMATVREMLRRK